MAQSFCTSLDSIVGKSIENNFRVRFALGEENWCASAESKETIPNRHIDISHE